MTGIRVRLFGAVREIVGSEELVMDPGGPVTTQALLEDLIARHPPLAEWRDHLRIAVNYEYTPGGATVSPGDEVAVIPPVSGG